MEFEKWVQLIVPMIGIIIAVVSASATYYYTKKKQLLLDESRLKEQCYLEYIDALNNNVVSDNLDESRSRLSRAHNHVLLLGDSSVVVCLRAFTVYIADSNKEFTHVEHDKLLTELLKSMRKDLYRNRKINNGYPLVSLSGKNHR